jgi:hypothetical protein
VAGIVNVCPNATEGCIKACLYTAGMGSFSNVKAARIAKTLRLMGGKKFNDQPHDAAILEINKDIESLRRKGIREGKKITVRLNGTSDLPVENWGQLMRENDDIMFYDYTKSYSRMNKFLQGKMPKNYHLTFSFSGENWEQCKKVLAAGGNVAAPMLDYEADSFSGYKVISGDETDLRFLDEQGCIVSLKVKGDLRKMDSVDFILDHK